MKMKKHNKVSKVVAKKGKDSASTKSSKNTGSEKVGTSRAMPIGGGQAGSIGSALKRGGY